MTDTVRWTGLHAAALHVELLLFLILEHTWNAIVAVFLPLSETKIDESVRKSMVYGKRIEIVNI